ncbi:MAG TPA: trigger factor [Saprospiraceae bacterium]|nr:trigger factor [Saprospiraceae bacterium]
MKIDFNRLDDLNARLTLVIERSDYQAKLEENLKNYSKKLNIKGFRSGKTPKSVLTKMYGKGMLEETVSTMLNEKLFAYLESENIEIFGNPVMNADADPIDFNPKAPQDYTFVFDLGLKPSFDLKYNFETPLSIRKAVTDQDALDQDIQRYRRVFGAEEPVTDGEVEQHDRVGIKLNRITEDGQAEEKTTETVVDLERIQGEAKTDLPGKKTGDTLDVDLVAFMGYARDMLVKNTLGLDADPDPENPLNYRVTIDTIARPQMTELSGDQLTKYVGSKVDDEASFRKMLEEREDHSNQTRTNDMRKMAVRHELLKANPFWIPEEFLLNWVNAQRQQKIEPGSREAGNLFREAKWSLLLNKIAKEEGLEVTEKDVQSQVTKWILENVNYRQTDVRKLMKELHANEYFMSTMKENALEEVVFGHIIPKYQFDETGATPEEFEHAFHDLHHHLFDHGDHSHA